jgi:hypothetical protein
MEILVSVAAGRQLLALIFYWSRWRGGGSNGLNYAVPVAGGAVAAAAMIGLGMVMTRFSFLRIFLELILGAGAVIAVALHWLHSPASGHIARLNCPLGGSSSRYNAN